MKQKKYLISVLTAMLLMVPTMVQAQSKGNAKTLEVSFDYQKQPGPGSPSHQHSQNRPKTISPFISIKSIKSAGVITLGDAG